MQMTPLHLASACPDSGPNLLLSYGSAISQGQRAQLGAGCLRPSSGLQRCSTQSRKVRFGMWGQGPASSVSENAEGSCSHQGLNRPLGLLQPGLRPIGLF